MSRIGKRVENVSATAVLNDNDIHEDYNLADLQGKYVCLFFYPSDFTFVCPTELHAFQDLLAEFESRNCQVVGCSIDSQFSHIAWRAIPKEEGGIKGTTYPLLADVNKEFARALGVLNDDGLALRATFILDKDGIVRHGSVNDLGIGRNVDETLRILDALQFHEENGDVCPVNWHKGDKGMKKDKESLKDYFKK